MTSSTPDGDQLRTAVALHAAERATAERATAEAPVSPDQMWDVICGELSGEEAHAIVDRVLASPSARLEWRVTVEAIREAGLEVVVAELDEATASEPAPVDELAARRRRRRGMMISAAVALAAAAAVLLLLRPDPRDRAVFPAVYRMVNRSLITSDSPAKANRSADLELRWRGAPSGSRYDVQVSGENLELIATGFNLTQPHFTLPAAKLSAVTGARLYWRVIAHAPDATSIQSQAFTVELAP